MRHSDRAIAAALVLFFAVAGIAGASKPSKSIVLPPPDQTFRDGPGAEVVRANCSMCHSADYIYMQPRLTRSAWLAEVTKMRKAYGAPISDDAVPTIVDYLVSQNGK
jgi:sulfite dehydrogenase (cytochrome) subunit B